MFMLAEFGIVKSLLISDLLLHHLLFLRFQLYLPPRWPSGKASASRAEDLGFESRLRRDFFGVESYQ